MDKVLKLLIKIFSVPLFWEFYLTPECRWLSIPLRGGGAEWHDKKKSFKNKVAKMPSGANSNWMSKKIVNLKKIKLYLNGG